MEGLGRALGSDISFELDGRTYRMRPMQFSDFGEMEQYILQRRPNPVEAIKPHLEGLPPQDRQVLLQCAYNDLKKGNKCTAQEINDFMYTPEGIKFSAWIVLRDHQPDIDSPEKAAVIVEKLGDEEFAKLREQAAGLDERGNSTGPPTAATAGTTESPASSSLGEESSDNSAKTTAGPPTT